MFIVDTIIPTHGVNLIGGSSGVGKTTFLLQTLAATQRGQEVLGHKSHCYPYVYMVADRPKRAVTATLERVGVSEVIDPSRIHSMLRVDQLSTSFITNILGPKYGREHTVVYIEGLVRLMRNGNMNDYKASADFLAGLSEWCINEGVTIIGTVHSTKQRERDLIYNPRERVLGSVAWAAFTNTIMFMEHLDPKDPTNPGRKLWVMPRETQPEEFDLSFTEDGKLELATDTSTSFLFESDLAALAFDAEITTAMVLEWATARNVTERTAFRWIKGMFDSGKLERVKKGVYKRV